MTSRFRCLGMSTDIQRMIAAQARLWCLRPEVCLTGREFSKGEAEMLYGRGKVHNQAGGHDLKDGLIRSPLRDF